jgi:hypothetical protein
MRVGVIRAFSEQLAAAGAVFVEASGGDSSALGARLEHTGTTEELPRQEVE